MITGRTSRWLAASSGLAALVLLAPIPGWLRLPASLWLLGVLPGVLFCRMLPHTRTSTWEGLAGTALAVSMPMGLLLALPLVWRPGASSLSTLVLGAACMLVALAQPERSASRPAPDRSAWLGSLAIGAFTAAPLAFNPGVRTYGDSLFHTQIAQELLTHGVPPMDPSFFDQRLAYAWGHHAWVAAMARLAGSSPLEVFPWLALLASAALALLFVDAARRAGLRTPLLGAMVMLGAMNGLGFVQAALRLGLAGFVGGHRDGRTLVDHLALWGPSPDAGMFAGALLSKGPLILSSFLYKFLCVNTVAPSLVLVAAAYASALAHRREGGIGRGMLTVLLTAGAALVHPVIGLTGGAALLAGLASTLLIPGTRARGAQAMVAASLGLLIAIPPLALMLEAPIGGGTHAQLHGFTRNLPSLALTLVVSLPLACLGLRRGWGQDREGALLALGFTAAAIVFSVVVEFPSDAYSYPVYLAYLGSAWLLPHGLAAVRDAVAGRPLQRRLARTGVALIPVTTILLGLVFLFHDSRGELYGFPATADERTVFDRLKHTPESSIVMDTQSFQLSAAAAYSARRSVFGGMQQVMLVGYPAAEMRRRELAIRDLLYASITSDSTWRMLDRFGPSLHVVARRRPSCGLIFEAREQPSADPIAKLDRLPLRFDVVVRTPTVALYRYRAHRDPPPRRPLTDPGPRTPPASPAR